ncbi:unnamed protein product [Bathycoccus prasinos]
MYSLHDAELTAMDPQQKLLLISVLRTCYGEFNSTSFQNDSANIVLGIANRDFDEILSSHAKESPHAATGSAFGSVAAGRVSFIFNMQGVSIAVDTACSSSLVATHTAEALGSKIQSRFSVVSGVNLMIQPTISDRFTVAGMLSSSGRCKTLDAFADGYVRAEACLSLLLINTDTMAQNNYVQHVRKESVLVLHGSAVNQDGRSSALTAPRGPSQSEVIMKATNSQTKFLCMVQLHGTGTSLGDPIEIGALSIFLHKKSMIGFSDEVLKLDGMKSWMGHAEPAAGIFGLSEICENEALYIDPRQRLLLFQVSSILKEKTLPHALQQYLAVVIGASGKDYVRLLEQWVFEDNCTYTGIGNELSVLSGRISYTFDCKSKCLVIDTACSSSLVGVHIAKEDCLFGYSKGALSAGASIIVTSELHKVLGGAGMLSLCGRCKTLEASADGYSRAECIVTVLLVNASTMLVEDKCDPILIGSSVNQDGRSSSLTAPNGPSQHEVIKNSVLNTDGEDSRIIQIHGTGTALGDPLEVAALISALSLTKNIIIESIKTWMGHAEPAAGILGMTALLSAQASVKTPGFCHLHPQQRLIVESTLQTLQITCSHDSSNMDVATFVGIQHMEYNLLNQGINCIGEPYIATGSALSVAAGRISFIFDFNGPAVSIDTACSASLATVHFAYNSSNLEIFCCGVNLTLTWENFASIQRAGMLTQDGRCKTLDARADGYGRGESSIVARVAKFDSESIKSTKYTRNAWKCDILASAMNQDGRSSSLTAPSGIAQQRVLNSAAKDLNQKQLGSVGLHGTGTSLGDPIELGALSQTLEFLCLTHRLQLDWYHLYKSYLVWTLSLEHPLIILYT